MADVSTFGIVIFIAATLVAAMVAVPGENTHNAANKTITVETKVVDAVNPTKARKKDGGCASMRRTSRIWAAL